ncbi:hypothetical protein DERP_007808 [Dermatophagoides pteronyssinus]|uniref:Uncharacterized protein n=1 Tax=Dermatophagoides pteronyssinus TaxID=6956 RepID=A0ABQ8ISN2_DERPT|nr:hypothetical protein DERP_007808 [Dermatophagoides pteronyssinus]
MMTSAIYMSFVLIPLIVVNVNGHRSSIWSDNYNDHNHHSSDDDQQPNIASLARGSYQQGQFADFEQDPRIWHSIRPYGQYRSSSESTIPTKQRIQFKSNDDVGIADSVASSSMNLAYLSRSKRSILPPPPLPLPPLPPPPPMMMLPPMPRPPYPFVPPPLQQRQAAASSMMPFMMMRNGPIPDNMITDESQQQQQQQHYHRRIYPKYPPNYGYNNDCQYHTIVNGDSEIVLRKLLPVRLVGRTIVRHCIEKPNFNDPRYQVLLKGNQKSSFGSLRLQMVQ